MSADVGVYDDSPPGDSDPRPTVNLFEYWEEGAHTPKVASMRGTLGAKRHTSS